MKQFPVGLVATAIALSSIGATLAEDQVEGAARPAFTPTSLTAPFIEQFTSDWSSRWSPSEATKEQKEGEVFSYSGKWSVEEPSVFPGLQGDEGLVLKTKANQHAISAQFPKVIDPKDKPLVVQYEVKLQKGLSCGGAYLKLLSESDQGIQEKEFSDKTPYTIMFGPDKCGTTNKVHFIFRHKNPVNGVIEEKHLVNAPYPKISKTSTLYTLIVNPNNTYDILINNESKKKGSLLEDFNPTVNPDKIIDDPNDSKPDNWVMDEYIEDVNAVKPDDWDDNAPLQIPDETSVKPENWLEDEALTVPDPSAIKPEEWDDEEDGEWIAPLVPNPKCQSDEVEGCGPWSAPMIPNPKWKGIWSPGLMKNPDYTGDWEPRQIENPNWFEDLNPSNFNPIAGIGFELWTMDEDILFDNIYIGHDAEEAREFSRETFDVKKAIEEGDEKKEDESKKKENDKKLNAAKSPKDKVVDFLKDQEAVLKDFIASVREDPVEAVKEQPNVAGVIAIGFFSVLTLFGSLLSGGGSQAKKVQAKPPKKVDAPKATSSAVKPATSSTTKRNARVEDAEE